MLPELPVVATCTCGRVESWAGRLRLALLLCAVCRWAVRPWAAADVCRSPRGRWVAPREEHAAADGPKKKKECTRRAMGFFSHSEGEEVERKR